MLTIKQLSKISLAALLFLTWAAQAQSEPLESMILGIWRAEIDSEALAEIGRGRENPDDLSLEIEFKDNGSFEMRVIDAAAYETTDVKYIEGSYIPEKRILKLSVVPNIWDKHNIEITQGSMYWRSSSPDRELSNQFSRAEYWSIE